MALITSKNPSAKLEYYLTKDYWDDFGFHTVWHLTVNHKENGNLIRTTVRFAEPNLQIGDFAFVDDYNPEYVSFIRQHSAIRMAMKLKPDQRQDLIKSLHVKFDTTEYVRHQWFRTSVLRGYSNMDDFMQSQKIVKVILTCESDLTIIFNRYLSERDSIGENVSDWLKDNFQDYDLGSLPFNIAKTLKEIRSVGIVLSFTQSPILV